MFADIGSLVSTYVITYMKDPSIYNSNICVCSHHFIEQDFVSVAIEGFGPKRPTLKPEAVPTIFCFSSIPCC